MANCEICGKEDSLVDVIVSNVKMSVCRGCSQYGKVLPKPKLKEIERSIFQRTMNPNSVGKEQPMYVLIEDYAEKVKKAREKINLTHEELGKKIAEKESMVQKIESGHVEPSVDVARKLEKFFDIILLEEFEDKKIATPKTRTDGLTLGDFMKKRK